MERIILGLDPGTIVMGFAVLKQDKNILTPLLFENLNFKKGEDYMVKLKIIYEKTIELIEKYMPDEIAVECPFLGKNPQSMLKLGRAQGAAISAGLSRNISVTEYTPKKIKMAVTGSGNASKEQVMGMVKGLLSLKEIPKGFDASDAMAVAICHYLNDKIGNDPVNGKKFKGWADFVNNKKEIIK